MKIAPKRMQAWTPREVAGSLSWKALMKLASVKGSFWSSTLMMPRHATAYKTTVARPNGPMNKVQL